MPYATTADLTFDTNKYFFNANDVYTTNSINATTFTYNPRVATTADLDHLARKVYEIITQHIKLDIDEDEFMELIKE